MDSIAKIKINDKQAYALVFLLVMLAGNPWITKREGFEYIYVVVCFILAAVLNMREGFFSRFRDVWIYLFFTLLIFLGQYFIFFWNTLPGIVNYCCKLILAGFIFILLGYRFKWAYLKVMYHLSVIALVFWALQQMGITFNLLYDGYKGESIFVYFANEGTMRNCGCFWEPGAYGCYLLMIPFLFVNDLPELWREHRKKCIVLLGALLSTQSTTAYVVFAAYVVLYMLFRMKSSVKIFLIPVVLVGAGFAYVQLDFLQQKIEDQNEKALISHELGAYSSTRVGSLLFDLKYIKKSPIFGNGIHSRTKFAEDPGLAELLEEHLVGKSGCGLSDQMVRMGVGFYVLFWWLFFKRNKRLLRSEKIIFFVALTLTLMGECLFNYPFTLGLCLCTIARPKDDTLRPKAIAGA